MLLALHVRFAVIDGSLTKNRAGNSDFMSMIRFSKSAFYRGCTIVALALATIGCDTFAADKRQVIAQDPEWTITAVGDLDSPGRGFRANLVRFEAARRGLLYADGELYEAGPHDNSFVIRYESREWIHPNTLRLAYVPPRDLVTVEVLVRNETSKTIKYLAIDTDELFLLLEVPPRESVKLPARRWGDFTAISLRGVFDGGNAFRASSDTFGDSTRRIEVTVRSEGVEIKEPQ